MDINRLKRIESLIRAELAELMRSEITDPKLRWLTITSVQVSADLSFAKIYVVSHNEKDTKQIIKILNQLSKSLRHQLAAKIRNLRKIPELRFYYDPSISEGNRIDQLLKEAEARSDSSDDA